MKKSILLLMIMMLSGVCVNAVDWQPVSTNNPGIDLYIDLDSIQKISNNECLYAIKYSVDGAEDKVAYIKSDSKTGYLGIINSGDYEADKYKPNAVFSEPHVFMKPISEGSFLKFPHDFVIAMTSGNVVAKNRIDGSNYSSANEIPVSYYKNDKLSPEMEGYVIKTCKLLEENWNPPESGNGSRAIVRVTIGNDGSLLNYVFEETSGDVMTDRSVISALKNTVLYPKFPDIVKDAYSLDFRYVFEHDVIRKSVVY